MNSRISVRTAAMWPVIVTAGLGLAACSSNSISKAASSPVSSSAKASAQSSHTASQAAAASPSASTNGPVGTTYTVTTTDDNDNKVTYDVTLTKVVSPATPADEFNTAPSGEHLVGAEFTIKGVSGTASDDANNDATVHGNNSQVYQPAFDTLAAGTNFNSGDFNVSPGASEIGWLSFEVPNSVSVTSVQWQPSAGFDNDTATWTVSK
jgi:hypothetical protein